MKQIISSILFLISFISISQTFTLRSNELGGQATNRQLLNGFGCSGENISPELTWNNPPKGTQSFAITMNDPDALSGKGWWHWIVYNIPNKILRLPSDAGNPEKNLLPKGASHGVTDFGKLGYGGPCLPINGEGYHPYIITIYALKTKKLDTDELSEPEILNRIINSQTIEKSSIIFYYRPEKK